MQEEFFDKPEEPQATEQNFQPSNPETPEEEKKSAFPSHRVIELILLAGLVVLYILFFTSKKPAETASPLIFGKSGTVPAKIMYINIDTLNEQYSYVKKLKTELESTGKRLENEILSEQAAFEKEATSFQNQVAAKTIAEDRAKILYEALMQKQQALTEKKDRYTQQVAEKEQAMHQTLLDTVTNFLKRYNRVYKFDYILGYAKSGQILLANDTLDITRDVVKALNKEYSDKTK
jgi:outer membrane protein